MIAHTLKQRMIQNLLRIQGQGQRQWLGTPGQWEFSFTILFFLLWLKPADVQNTELTRPSLSLSHGRSLSLSHTPEGLHCSSSPPVLAMLVGGRTSCLHLISKSLKRIPIPTTATIVTNGTTGSQVNCSLCKTEKQNQEKPKPSKENRSTALLHLVHSQNMGMTCENQYKTFIFPNHRILNPRATL